MGLLGIGLLGTGQVPGRRAVQGVGDDVSRDGAVSLEPGAFGLVVAAQQGRVGDDDADVEAGGRAGAQRCSVIGLLASRRSGVRCAAAKGGVHEQVRLERRDGVLRPGRPEGLGPAVEGLHHPGRIDPAQHGADLGHSIGQRRHRHVAGSRGPLGSITGLLGLELLDQHLHFGAQLPLPGTRERHRVRADQLVEAGDGVRVRLGQGAGQSRRRARGQPSGPQGAVDLRHLGHQAPGGCEREGGRGGGDAAGVPDLVGGTLALLRSAHLLRRVVLADPLLGADLPLRVEGGEGGRQLVEAAEHGEGLLGSSRGRARQRVPYRGRQREGLQRGREDLGEHHPCSGAAVEPGEPTGDVAQKVAARRGSIDDRFLLVGTIPAARRVHAIKRTHVRNRSEGQTLELWIT